FPRWVTTLELVLKICESKVGEYLLTNVLNRHVLEDPAVGRARQEPEPGNHFGGVDCETSVVSTMCEPAHVSVQESCALTVAEQDAEGHVLANYRCEVQIVVLREEVELEAEELRNCFVSIERAQEKLIVAQRRIDHPKPTILNETLW